MMKVHTFGFCSWGWISLQELSEVLGLEPIEVVERYWALSKDAHYGVLAVTTGYRIINPQWTTLRDVVRDPRAASVVFVPAGWAFEVLEAKKAGFERVLLEQMFLEEDEVPPPDVWGVVAPCGDNEYWVAVGRE